MQPLLSVGVVLVFAGSLSAQGTGTLTGTVIDPSGAAIPSVQVEVLNAVNNFRAAAATDTAGGFSLRGLPLQGYQVRVRHGGFAQFEQTVTLRSPVPVRLAIRLELASERQSVTIVDDTGGSSSILVDPEQTGTRVQMNQADIDRLSRQVANRGLESIIVSFPGFAQNANGAIHPRGAHNQMSFVIDGMPVNDQLTGAFANAVDPNIVRTVELYTGNIPAEYGSKVAAVASITTRSGQGSGRRFAGSTTLGAARFDLLSQVTQISGESGRVGYAASINTMKTNRYLDAVSLANLHNGGNSERAFLRIDYQASPLDVIRLSGMAGRSSFESPNLRSQHAAGMDQRQLLRDASGSVAWVRTLTPRSVLEALASYRTTEARLMPSAFDTPIRAAQSRHLSTATAGMRWNTLAGAHNLRGGFDVQRFPVSESFSFGITEPAFNAAASPGFNPNLAPYDLTRPGGRLFRYADRGTGAFDAGFIQDQIRLGAWQLSLGLRFDSYRFLVNGTQAQPRLGVSYHLRDTGTVFRASYNRLYQTPPNENLLLSSSPAAAAIAPPIITEALGTAVVLIRPERQDFLEAGIEQAIAGRARVSVSYYHKRARDQQDNNNFLNTGVIFPITLARIRVNGLESRLTLPEIGGVSSSVSFTHSRAISTPPFTGGLYIGNEALDLLTAGPFVIDHDQPLAIHTIVNYRHRRGFYANFSARYDSGLVANPSDPAEVAADPDYADLLPYVRLGGQPSRVRPRTIADAGIGYEHTRGEKKVWDASLQFTNLTNRTALYNFQSVFVGTRVVQPFTAGCRLRFYF